MYVFLAQFTRGMENKYPQYPVYIAATVYSQSIKDIKENLYLVGLVFKYSLKRFDNLESIKYNIGYNLRLDYLDYDWYSEKYLVKSGLDRLNMNYVVLFLKLAEAYHDSGHNNEALKWTDKALVLAEYAGNQESIKHINELNW